MRGAWRFEIPPGTDGSEDRSADDADDGRLPRIGGIGVEGCGDGVGLASEDKPDGTVEAEIVPTPGGQHHCWHQHPGIGAYTIVKTGTLTVEDGCGGEVVYPQGTAFIEPPGRVHRGIAGDDPVETVQTFLVPLGSAFSVNVPKACGAPLVVEECKRNGWEAFTYPRTFSNQGDCVKYVRLGSD
jgi:quercetin dioxygenase-like cupin family protein